VQYKDIKIKDIDNYGKVTRKTESRGKIKINIKNEKKKNKLEESRRGNQNKKKRKNTVWF
jgi:hypothetical protein